MDANKINTFLAINAENFSPIQLQTIKEKLEQLDDDKLLLISSLSYQKPSTMLLISILLGWERFWMEDITLGLIKILTAYGCGIWWIADMFTAKKRAQKYNFEKLMNVLNIY